MPASCRKLRICAKQSAQAGSAPAATQALLRDLLRHTRPGRRVILSAFSPQMLPAAYVDIFMKWSQPDRDAPPLACLLEAPASPGDRTRLKQGNNRHLHVGLIDKAG